MNKEARYINMYKGLAIICLVISRLLFVDDVVTNTLGSFCVCMLYVAAGASLDVYSEGNIKRAAKKYLVPYFAFSLVIVFSCAMSVMLKKQEYDVYTLRTKLLNTCTFYGESMLWILSTLFFAILVYVFLRRVSAHWMIFLGSGVLMAAYLLCGNIFDFISASNNIFQSISFRLFAVLWRVVFACLYISVGEMIGSLLRADDIRKKRGTTVPLGFALVVLGLIIAVYNNNVYVTNLYLGYEAMFYSSTIMICIGLLFIAEWIGVLKVLEFVGENAITVIATFADFKVVYVGSLVDAAFLALFNNRFIAHAGQSIVIIAFEIVLIWIFARVLPVMIGKSSYKPFAIFANNDSEIQE